jgi:hypothetical protein
LFICAALLVTAWSTSFSKASTIATSTAVNIVNGSSRDIRNVYLSHVDADDWGNNQLGESVIAASQSFTLTISSWDQQQIKVVAEDQEGCFLSTVVTSGSNSTWTVSNDTARDCGY